MEQLTVIRNGQDILDMAMQQTGNADNALAIAEQNGLSVTDDIAAGEAMATDTDIADTDTAVVAYLSERSLFPATGISEEDKAAAPYGGINYMGIEIDFIVS